MTSLSIIKLLHAQSIFTSNFYARNIKKMLKLEATKFRLKYYFFSSAYSAVPGNAFEPVAFLVIQY